MEKGISKSAIRMKLCNYYHSSRFIMQKEQEKSHSQPFKFISSWKFPVFSPKFIFLDGNRKEKLWNVSLFVQRLEINSLPAFHHHSALFFVRGSWWIFHLVDTVKLIESNRKFCDQLNKTVFCIITNLKAELSNQVTPGQSNGSAESGRKNCYWRVLWTRQLFSLPLFTFKTHQSLSKTHRPYPVIAKRKSTN